MTKTNMIEAIQKKEAALWLATREHEWKNAPVTGDIADEIFWELNDEVHNFNLHAWNAVYEIMLDLGIECKHCEQSSWYADDLWHRRRAARNNEIPA